MNFREKNVEKKTPQEASSRIKVYHILLEKIATLFKPPKN